MNLFEEIRRELTERHTFLSRRIRSIAESPGLRLASSNPADSEAELEQMMRDSEQELAMVESSLRRIQDRSFDTCIHCGSTIPMESLRVAPYAVSCHTCSRDFDLDYFQRVRIQRRSFQHTLKAISKAIAEALGQSRVNPEPHSSMTVSRIMLSDLEREFENHFEAAERRGQLTEALLVAPRLSKRAEALCAEHEELMDHIRAVVGHAYEAGTSVRDWQTIQSSFANLAIRLLHHERAENEILSAAFLDDIGSGD